MKLPSGDKAVVEREKLIGYCLNFQHIRGKHKARVFAAALGITVEDADELKADLLTAAANEEAEPTISDHYGDRYIIDFTISRPQGQAVIRSTWIIKRGETNPRLTSCYVK